MNSSGCNKPNKPDGSVYLWWSLCNLYIEDIPLVEFMYLVY